MTSLHTPAVSLRPATDNDAEFLYRVFASTRYEELAPLRWPPEQVEAFLRMQFNAQHTDYHANCPDATFDVILCDGKPGGRLYVDRLSYEIRIVDISLLPEYRGAGIGTLLLKQAFAEGVASKLPVRIHVEIFNRARHLYERLGFVRIDGNGVYDLMERASS